MNFVIEWCNDDVSIFYEQDWMSRCTWIVFIDREVREDILWCES